MIHFTIPDRQRVDIIKYFVKLVTIAFPKKPNRFKHLRE